MMFLCDSSRQGVRRRLLPHALSVIAVAVFASSRAHAGLIDTFKAEYPAAEARLRDAYRHVKMVAVESRHDEKGGFLWTERSEYICEGDSVCAVKTTLRSASPKVGVGAVSVFGGDTGKHFQMNRKQGSDRFVMTAFGPNSDFADAVRLRCLPLFAPYCTLEMRIADYVKQKHVTVASAEMFRLDGEDVIDVITEERRTSDQQVRRVHFYFTPRTWALTGWIAPFAMENQPATQPGQPQAGWQGRVFYQSASDPPKIKALEYWINYPSKPGVKASRRQSEVSLIEFGPVPKTQFTLAAFGVSEPALPSNNTRVFWLILVNALLLAAVVFYLLSRRRQRATANSASSSVNR